MSFPRKTLQRVYRSFVGWMILTAGCGLGARAQEKQSGSSAGLNVGVFPLAEVHRGLKGQALTVFEGASPEPMEVEILGVLKNSLGPGRDMILARLGGPKAQYTGVVAGMSGSPIYIHGRLLGAVSYRIGQFSKEPIAGITPIEEMFEVRDTPAPGGMQAASARAQKQPDGAPTEKAAFAGSDGMQAIETPLVFGGFSQESVDRFAAGFRDMGLSPVSGLGGRDRDAKEPESLVPGSAVSAILVDGDLSITGTCTVTYVDPKRLLACGHPITQYGAVDIPMSKAEVLATLPSPMNAFKIVNATEVVGAFTEDRASAILGRFGERARMIPVEVEVKPDGDDAGSGATRGGRTYHLQVLDNRQLTPQAMMVSVYQTLQQTNASAAETSFHLSGEIGVSRRGVDGKPGNALPPVKIAALLAPTDFNSGAINTALLVGDRFNRVYGDLEEQPVVTGVHLQVEVDPRRRSAEIIGARLNRSEARAGETVELEITLHPYHGAPEVVRQSVHLPDALPSGPMRMLVSDGAMLDRLTSPRGQQQRTGGLLDAVSEANRLHANDRIYITVLSHAAQAVLPSGALQAVPLSMANVLDPSGDAQRLQLTGESVSEVGSVAVPYATTGFQVLELTIR